MEEYMHDIHVPLYLNKLSDNCSCLGPAPLLMDIKGQLP